MGVTIRQAPMLRKPILMPPSMVRKVDKIAKAKNVSFAEIVREAVSSFAGQPTAGDEVLLESLAETMIATTKELCKKIDELEKRLDDTHMLLEAQ